MKTLHVLLVPATGGFFYDDQAAIRGGAVKDGERHLGQPATPGFPAVRIPASAVSIGLVLESGFVAWGDAMSVQYAGVAGRDVALDADRELPSLRRHLVPWLVGRDVAAFRENAAAICALSVEGRPSTRGSGTGSRRRSWLRPRTPPASPWPSASARSTAYPWRRCPCPSTRSPATSATGTWTA